MTQEDIEKLARNSRFKNYNRMLDVFGEKKSDGKFQNAQLLEIGSNFLSLCGIKGMTAKRYIQDLMGGGDGARSAMDASEMQENARIEEEYNEERDNVIERVNWQSVVDEFIKNLRKNTFYTYDESHVMKPMNELNKCKCFITFTQIMFSTHPTIAIDIPFSEYADEFFGGRNYKMEEMRRLYDIMLNDMMSIFNSNKRSVLLEDLASMSEKLEDETEKELVVGIIKFINDGRGESLFTSTSRGLDRKWNRVVSIVVEESGCDRAAVSAVSNLTLGVYKAAVRSKVEIKISKYHPTRRGDSEFNKLISSNDFNEYRRLVTDEMVYIIDNYDSLELEYLTNDL